MADQTKPRSSPLRLCVGCRVRAERSKLLRVVSVDGSLVPDPAKRFPGRGAHLHLDLGCLDLAERRRAFPRALRLPGRPLDISAVREAVTIALQQQGRQQA